MGFALVNAPLLKIGPARLNHQAPRCYLNLVILLQLMTSSIPPGDAMEAWMRLLGAFGPGHVMVV